MGIEMPSPRQPWNTLDANLFRRRVLSHWNKLLNSVVIATSTSCFKKRLCEFMRNVGLDVGHTA